VREFDRRLVAWAAENGWTPSVSRGIHKLFDPEGIHGFTFYPGWEAVQVSLNRFSADEALFVHALRRRLETIRREAHAEKMPQVPIVAVLRYWDEFFGDSFPAGSHCRRQRPRARGNAETEAFDKVAVSLQEPRVQPLEIDVAQEFGEQREVEGR
jgi:hypothetical protein